MSPKSPLHSFSPSHPLAPALCICALAEGPGLPWTVVQLVSCSRVPSTGCHMTWSSTHQRVAPGRRLCPPRRAPSCSSSPKTPYELAARTPQQSQEQTSILFTAPSNHHQPKEGTKESQCVSRSRGCAHCGQRNLPPQGDQSPLRVPTPCTPQSS